MTRRIDFLKISIKLYKLYFDDSKNWALFFFFEKTWLIEIELFFTWVKELNPFLNMTQRIEKFSWFFDSKNWTFFEYDSKIWIFSWMWLTELNFFIDSKKWVLFFRMTKILLNTTQRIEPLFEYVPRIEPFLEFHSMDWTLCTKGLKELDPKRLFEQQNLLMTWWIGPFFSIWLKELIFFSKISLNYWPFLTSLTELNSFLEHDSQNWTFFFFENMTHWDWTLLFFLSQKKWLHF